MAARIAWWLNLDSALELEEPRRYVRDPRMSARIAGLTSRLQTLLRASDVLIGQQGASSASWKVDAALPFCPTPSALVAIRSAGYAAPLAPPLEVLSQVTRRSFCAALGQTLPNARYVRCHDELAGHLATGSFTGEWLLKRDFGFAGRERRRVRGRHLDSSTLGFAKRSFARGQGLQVEPYVQRLGDFAQHGYLLPDGELLWGDVMAQSCDERGVWQSSAPAACDALTTSERSDLEGSLRKCGAALHDAGYFGPFGVDAYRYIGQRGTAEFQARSEINPRFSMGYPRALLERALAHG